MQGLSIEIESGIKTVIEGLNYDIGIDYSIKNNDEYSDYIGYNIIVNKTSGGKLKGRLEKVNPKSITISYFKVSGKERVKSESLISFLKIKDARVYEEESDLLEPEKMKAIIDSKVSSFDLAKKMMNRWVSSPNAPTEDKQRFYIEKIVSAGEKALTFLRESLAHDIDFDEIEKHKIALAIKAKPIILNAVFELDSSLKELRDKLDNDDLSLVDREFKIGYPERYAKGEFFPVEDYWKKWYNESKEAVGICPFSTKGEIITLEDLNVQLPKPPRDKSKILFSDSPKSEQYWRRLDFPKNITPDNVDGWEDVIKEEFRRRREGIWFMNNGKPVYLTGNHYFALQWCRMLDSGGFMDFRYAQLNMFYHLEACIVDKRCLGQLFLKSRRTGFTYTVLSIILNMATSTANAKYGMTSKSGDDVEEAFEKLSYMFLSLPFFFRPVVKGKEDSLNELFFAKPSNNSKEAKKARNTGVADYLNTNVDHRPTKNDSYDSVKLDAYLGDECISLETKVLRSDLQFVEARTLKEGDFVMGVDGKPKKIAIVYRGTDEMYLIKQKYGKDYVVNKQHKLLLSQKYGTDNKVRNIQVTPDQYLEMNVTAKRKTLRRTTPALNLSHADLPISPYIMGIWLGDGTSKSSIISVNETIDSEISNEIRLYFSKDKGYSVSANTSQEKCTSLYISDTSRRDNRFINNLRNLNVWGNKHIPDVYFNSSVEQRLQLLAGIVDTDGYRIKNSNCYSVEMSSKQLVEDIYKLCVITGLSTGNIVKRNRSRKGSILTSYKVSFTDPDCIVPFRLDRRKGTPSRFKNRRGSVEVESIGLGEYIGFTLETEEDELRTLILEDGTLTKNCFKWQKPHDYITHLGMVSPTMMPAGKVVGKAFIGSTMGAMVKGGEQGVELIKGSKVKDRDDVTGKTSTGLYFYFLAAQDNMEEFTDKYGYCHTTKPPKGTLNVAGEPILTGSIEYLLAVEDQKRRQSDKALNEQLRTYPRTVDHALRDESEECVFNLTKLYEQLEFNRNLPESSKYSIGNFDWEDGIIDTKVVFNQNKHGRFKVYWLPSIVDGTEGLANRVKETNGKFYPLNKECVRIGIDPFSLKSTHGEGSKGGAHGKTLIFPEGGAPSNVFVFEYLARPSDETVFFEDMIKVMRYYGAPALVESNRIDLLRHMRNRGYRGFAMNRLDRHPSKLNPNEKEYGGQVMSGKDILDSHMNSIGAWIEKYVGKYSNEEEKLRPLDEMGEMVFDDTLKDWLSFNPDDRTKYDATISSGLAIMACQTEKYKQKPVKKDTGKNALSLLRKYKNN